MSKFTKGEWEIDNSGYFTCISKTNDVGVERICTFPKEQYSEANAHLIAAAPNGFDLGELVIKMCDHHEGLSPDEVDTLFKAATAFIKKSKGEL